MDYIFTLVILIVFGVVFCLIIGVARMASCLYLETMEEAESEAEAEDKKKTADKLCWDEYSYDLWYGMYHNILW